MAAMASSTWSHMPVGEDTTVGDEGVAGPGGDGEPRRHGYPQRGHLGEVRALAPEQSAYRLPIAADRLLGGFEFIEAVHPSLGHVVSP